MAMQGIIAKTNIYEYEDMAKYAVCAADCLLAKLSTPNQPLNKFNQNK
jgi:hypothetical protein